MDSRSIDGVVLDHVAHAVTRWQDAWYRYAVDLGARWTSGGESIGFAPAQLRFGNGARIELLMPWATDVNDFLVRFLARHGPGAHHLTFKVPDLSSALEHTRSFGLEPVGIDRSDPQWMEAFLHPKQATGIVVQIAEAPSGWDSPPPSDFPVAHRPRPDGSGPVPAASLERVVHVVADLDAAIALFRGLLGGRTVGGGTGKGQRWVDLTWDGPLQLRLVAPDGEDRRSALSAWLGSRTGRVHHLALAADDPSTLPAARPAQDPSASIGERTDHTRWEIAGEANLGLRLVLEAR